jgi:hypothetical protein
MGVEVAVGMGLLSVGTNLWAANQQKKAQKAQYDAQIKSTEADIQTLEDNHKLYLEAANDALLEGQYQEGIFQLEKRQVLGEQEANIAARGLALTGSSLQVIKDTTHNILYDSNRIKLPSLPLPYALLDILQELQH